MDHDGILTLLQIPDPAEKKLALKSKLVEPYHLRHALQDSDPHVRAVAASHPALTKELMTEILASDDKDLRHVVLARPDVTEEHLEDMATHPDHALEVSQHPRCNDHIRQIALNHHAVPIDAKLIHSNELNKNIGFLTYPLLGEGKVYTKPMMGYKPPGKDHDPTHIGAVVANYRDNTSTEPHEQKLQAWVQKVKPVPGTKQTQGRLDIPDPYKRFLVASKIDTGKTQAGTESHEAQHTVYARLAHKYGDMASRRVLATTLSKLSPEHRAHIKMLHMANGGVHSVDPDPEETIAYLHNYLQDPTRRNAIHAKLGLVDLASQRDAYDRARKAWHSLRRIGMSMRPEDVGITLHSAQDRMANWVKTLGKRESMPSDQLGFSVSFFEMIAICEFLTQRHLDQQTIRQSIRNADGDGLTGVLSAYGLNDEKGRKAYDSVKFLKLHKNEDILKAPKSIEPLVDPLELTGQLKEAYGNGEVVPVKLGGKHSSGFYMTKDKEGHNWLLKPGSGKKSPAAGVDETKGSQSRREALFSAIAEWMGIKEVQPSSLFLIDGKEIAAIRMWPMDWVNLHKTLAEDPTLPRRALEPYRRTGALFKWSLLDFVTGNPDRHGNNLMVGPEDEGNKVGLIDHGSSMAGPHFDPGNDKDSFVPYYLRVWAGPNFHALKHSEQLVQMPTITGAVEGELREWLEGLDPKELETICYKYGMDPAPLVTRLNEAQSDPMTENVTTHLNALWLESPSA